MIVVSVIFKLICGAVSRTLNVHVELLVQCISLILGNSYSNESQQNHVYCNAPIYNCSSCPIFLRVSKVLPVYVCWGASCFYFWQFLKQMHFLKLLKSLLIIFEVKSF